MPVRDSAACEWLKSAKSRRSPLLPDRKVSDVKQPSALALLPLPRLAGISQRQKTRAGNFGSRTLRALSAPVTGSPAGSSKPTCTSTLA